MKLYATQFFDLSSLIDIIKDKYYVEAASFCHLNNLFIKQVLREGQGSETCHQGFGSGLILTGSGSNLLKIWKPDPIPGTFHPIMIMIDRLSERPTNQPTDQPTERQGHRKVYFQ